MTELDDCPLSRLLVKWHTYLIGASPRWYLRFAIRLPATKVGFYLTLASWFVCGPMEVAAAVSMGASLTEAMVGIQWTIGTYSGLWCEHLMRRSRLQLADCVGDLTRYTSFLEINGSPATKERLRRTARKKILQVYFYAIYGVSTLFGVIATFLTMRPHWAEVTVAAAAQAFGVEPSASSVFALTMAILPVEVVGLVCVICCYYTVLPLLFLLYGTAAELHTAVAQALQDGPCTDGWAALQSDLIGFAGATREEVAHVVPHILVASIVLPLFCTVDLLVSGREAGFFAINAAPLILTLFVASSETGETVWRAVRGFPLRAFSGPWLEEDVAARRMRLALMQASRVPSIKFHGLGIGELNRHACTAALQAWFRFLQGVLNIQHRN